MSTVLDERKLDILRYIVMDYVATAEPVGSRTLARKYRLGFSPATIRNEMADLEAMGLLEQPHTSAGRVPTDQGYRTFVDRLMQSEAPPAAELQRVRKIYARTAREIEGLIRQTAQVLSETTNTLSLVQGPPREQVILHALQVVPLRGRRAVLVLVTDEGLVENRFIELP
ncbi:MAG: heat-inducible transcriptional repressor HrcA, partial [Thermaerobacterales bacterium]